MVWWCVVRSDLRERARAADTAEGQLRRTRERMQEQEQAQKEKVRASEHPVFPSMEHRDACPSCAVMSATSTAVCAARAPTERWRPGLRLLHRWRS
jgi:hypothetical protein